MAPLSIMPGLAGGSVPPQPFAVRPRDISDLLPGRNRIVRDHGTLDPSLGRLGSLEVRLATTTREIRRAQKLRYKVFFEEMSAAASGASRLSRRDIDDFDLLCDHLLVLDHAWQQQPLRTLRNRKWSAPTGCCGRKSRTGIGASTRRANTTSRP